MGQGESLSTRGGETMEGIFQYANGRERQAKNVNGRGIKR